MLSIRTGISLVAFAAIAGTAMGQISSINGVNVAVRNFNDFPTTNLSINGSAQPNGQSSFGIGGLSSGVNFDETFALGAQGNFANRHLAFFSNDGGTSAYQLQNSQSFLMTACFRMTTNHPTGIGAPVNSETGFWIHNARTGLDGNGNPVQYTDEGGVWMISNGTSFSGGAGMDFQLYGEGGFNNPNSPPIIGNGELIQASFAYYAPGSRPGHAGAFYEATVTNTVSGISVSSGMKSIGTDAAGVTGFGNGTTFGFRAQNSRFPLIETHTPTEVNCITIVPAPASIGLLGLAGVFAGRRRR